MANPFINVPWTTPFLPSLMDIALKLTNGDMGNIFFVFPHARPAMYITELLRNDERIAKPCIMPRMESVSSLFSLLRGLVDSRRMRPVGTLDQVALLLAAVRSLHGERAGLLGKLPLDDSRRFFPWGVRLATLMEEFFTHNRVPENYIHMHDEATPFAAALLENLGAIHERYLASLTERGWTTPGLDASITATSIEAGTNIENLPPLAGKHIILAGFHTLTGAQQSIFRHLWEHCNATVCLHADPHVCHGTPHWSCVDLVRLATAWRTTIIPHSSEKSETTGPTVAFRAGYDVHSQIGDLAELLQSEPENTEKTAIVLPDTGLLLPVLHHLPNMDVNISMGYPLGRSPLFRLLESMLSLRETRRGNAPYAYYWKTLIAILRHPYCKMLDPFAGQEETAYAPERNFRRFLYHAERTVRASQRFLPLENFTERCSATFTKEEGIEADPALPALFRRILQVAITNWETVTNPGDMAHALTGLLELMHDHGAALWRHFPIDAECLYRLNESIIPQLAHTALAEETLPAETLFAVLRQLLASERVPFEAAPLVGKQIMGILETRLLHFDRLFVLDLTEDRLPGKQGHDPLLPDSLRPLAGLPGAYGREKVAAYNFFRLIAGADNVTLYWQQGVEAQGLNDAKKMRSRFVEELLWEEEKKSGRILAPEKPEKAGQDGPLQLITCVLPPVTRLHRNISATPPARQRVREILRNKISPTALDTYLGCPARFYHSRINRIQEVKAVSEGRDPAGTGKFLHHLLHQYFSSRIGHPVAADSKARGDLREMFFSEFATHELHGTLPFDDRIMLEEAGPYLLESILENHAGRIPLYLEKEFQTDIFVDGERRILAGCIDRVDSIDGLFHVLDYKTGRVPLLDKEVWYDDAFWQTLSLWKPADGNEALDLTAKRFASIQLPAYMLMVGNAGQTVHDAAYVPLQEGKEDVWLLGPDMKAAERKEITENKIHLLFSFLLRHIAAAEEFSPRPGENCGWCLYKNLCIVSQR